MQAGSELSGKSETVPGGQAPRPEVEALVVLAGRPAQTPATARAGGGRWARSPYRIVFDWPSRMWAGVTALGPIVFLCASNVLPIASL